jgi:hypothetical protein
MLTDRATIGLRHKARRKAMVTMGNAAMEVDGKSDARMGG